MKILYTFLNFNSFTGSELYYYELAREMVLLGHKVTIASVCGGKIKEQAENVLITCTDFASIKNFNDFDVVHASHWPVVEQVLKCDIRVPFIVTCHSEILQLERIPNHSKISHFIGIRKSIFSMLPEGKRTLIYNPVDDTRFNTNLIKDDNLVFFPGTINYLRISPLLDVIKTYGHSHDIVCMGTSDYPKFERVTYLPLDTSPEIVMKRASIVAGIINGRTGIEAAFCGKPYLNYTVDSKGNILGKTLVESSKVYFEGYHENKNYFTSGYVAKRIELLYREFI